MKTKILVLVLLLVIMTANIRIALATEPSATISPTYGTLVTDIFLKIRGLEAFNLDSGVPFLLYAYWDGLPFIKALGDPTQGIVGQVHLHYYDVTFRPPDEPLPYSNLGEHIIFVEVYQGPFQTTQLINFTLTFSITEYMPPTSEWWKWWDLVPQEIKDQLKGEQGIQGQQGSQGTQGAQGVQGIQGSQGVQGESGQNGLNGKNGEYPVDTIIFTTAVSVIALVVSVAVLLRKSEKEKAKEKIKGARGK